MSKLRILHEWISRAPFITKNALECLLIAHENGTTTAREVAPMLPVRSLNRLFRNRLKKGCGRALSWSHSFPGSYSATGITHWATQQPYLGCFFQVSPATLAIFFISAFSSPAFSIPRFSVARICPISSCVFRSRVFHSRSFSVPGATLIQSWNCQCTTWTIEAILDAVFQNKHYNPDVD